MRRHRTRDLDLRWTNGREARSEAGQALVEFALVLPVLLVLLLGIADFGRILLAQYAVAHAARDAAREASVSDSTSNVGVWIAKDTASLGQAVHWTVNPAAELESGQSVTVTVSTQVPLFDPILAAFLGGQYSPSATVSFRVE
ncbi:MAG: pilus assembly protein [Alicyclobacillus sp.]|nr:pilus assembly protein [Alicyclobacillus sp.]